MAAISISLTLVAILVHLAVMKKPRSAGNVLEVILLYSLFILLGVGTFLAGLMHIFNGPATAQMIGWQPGSPFQFEVGAADLALGTLGILSLFLRGNFWPAAIIANAVFLLTAFAGHVHDLLVAGNTAAYNIGPAIIFSDLVVPLGLIGLYLAWLRIKTG